MLSKSSKVQHQERALMYLEKSIELDRFSFSARYMYANLLSTHSHRRQEAIEQYQIILEHKPASVETLINLGAVYMKENALTKALECYAQALRYTDTSEGEYPEIYYNYGTILRRLERQEEAIEWVWNMLKRQLPQDDDALSMLDCTKPQAVVSCPASSDDTIILTIVCVKWGTKYSSEYVNKLYRGVRRNLSRDFRMVCLTENQDGLDPEIQCQELPSEQPFKGWWTKVHLFNPAMKLPRGKKVYIDLDTVIVGSLDTLVGLHPTTFGVLGTDTMKNEQRTGGYNSSMMIWQDQRHVKHVYDFLSRHYTVISKFIHKFDHWLEVRRVKCLNILLLQPRLTTTLVDDVT